MVTKVASSRKVDVKVMGDRKNPTVPLAAIQLAERPEEGKEGQDRRIFFNPRSIESFDDERMTTLRQSIQEDGLHQPVIVRAYTEDGTAKGKVTKIELVAGERRYRSLMWLCDNDEECYDADSKSMVPASQLYGNLDPKYCRTYWNITDQQALKIAFQENNEHKSLTTAEEISLVERLVNCDMRQDEIADTLGTNVTWVSQTTNFRKELPADAFSKLIDGKMKRHVAVQILSFKSDDRARLYQEAVEREEAERLLAMDKVQDQIEQAEDEQDIAQTQQNSAARKGNKGLAKKAQKKAEAAEKKLLKAKEKKEKVEIEAGVIKQGHILGASHNAGIRPKKAKMLPRPAIEQYYVDLIAAWEKKGKVCTVTKQQFPADVLMVMRMTAEAILNGCPDPACVVRKFMLDRGKWTLPSGAKLPLPEVYDDEWGGDE